MSERSNNLSSDSGRGRTLSAQTSVNSNTPVDRNSCRFSFSPQPHLYQTQDGVQIRGHVQPSSGPLTFSFGQSRQSGAVPSSRLGPASSTSESELTTPSSNAQQPPSMRQQTGDVTMSHSPFWNSFSAPGIAINQYGPVQNFSFITPGSYNINTSVHPVHGREAALHVLETTSSYQTQRHGSNEEPMDTVEMRTTFTGTIPPAQPNFRPARF